MKVALIADTHWGARNDSQRFRDYFTRFCREVFFPYLHEHRIRKIVHLGDLVDRRKFVNYETAKVMREEFIARVDRMDILIGNHDCPLKDTNRVNAVRELVGEQEDIHIVEDPTETYVDGVPVLYLPWINRENGGEAFRLIQNSDADVVFGHLDLAGFEANKGHIKEDGQHGDATKFSRFDQVFSGHYHHKSSKGNVHYLGSPYEIRWDDHDDPKGFHVWDSETKALEFVRNPLRMHEKINYNSIILPEGTDFSSYRDKIIKVIVRERNDLAKLDDFIKNLEKVGADVQVVDDHLHMDVIDDLAEVGSAADTMEIIERYVQGLPVDVDKPRLDLLLRDVYREATDRQC